MLNRLVTINQKKNQLSDLLVLGSHKTSINYLKVTKSHQRLNLNKNYQIQAITIPSKNQTIKNLLIHPSIQPRLPPPINPISIL